MTVTRGVGSMDETEVTDILKNNKVGILCLEDGKKPYAVPLEHYYKGNSLYFATSYRQGQRKINCIQNNGNATYVLYDSRRENQESLSKGIRCRSIIVDGQISTAGIKELDDKEFGRVKLQMLKLEIDKIENWKCPREKCHWHAQWFERHPELVDSL